MANETPKPPKPLIDEREFLKRTLGRLSSRDPRQVEEARKAIENRLQRVK